MIRHLLHTLTEAEHDMLVLGYITPDHPVETTDDEQEPEAKQQMMRSYLIVPRDYYDPRGPDGQGRNRLRIEIPTISPRCAIAPLDYGAAWDHQHRPLNVVDGWDHFDYCINDVQNCDGCRRAEEYEACAFTPLIDTVIREDEQGCPWLMHRQDDGWGETGIRYRSWGHLIRSCDIIIGRRGRDEHGVFYRAHRAQPTKLPVARADVPLM